MMIMKNGQGRVTRNRTVSVCVWGGGRNRRSGEAHFDKNFLARRRRQKREVAGQTANSVTKET